MRRNGGSRFINLQVIQIVSSNLNNIKDFLLSMKNFPMSPIVMMEVQLVLQILGSSML
jgi:hypothetical protein